MNPETSEDGLKKLAIREVDGQKKTLTELGDKVKDALYAIRPDYLIEMHEIHAVILAIASRICYGVYDRNVAINEDCNPLAMYIWEAGENP